jgi:hypothetical protein
METFPTPTNQTRLGFHYFPDTLHYRESDLVAWIPELRALGAAWLVLMASPDRAIPEPFIRGLVSAGIEPIVHFPMALPDSVNLEDFTVLITSYAKWGVHYVIFFDRPNIRSTWQTGAWAQDELVERFLDRYIPLAETAINLGLFPVFPPLEPGGDYWDTAFLQSALASLQRRKQQQILDRLVLSAYCWTAEKSLNWGAGGPEKWKKSRPYFTPAGEEDQRGFRISDWYQAVAYQALQRDCPIILLGGGAAGNHTDIPPKPISPVFHAQVNYTIARLMAGEQTTDPVIADTPLEPVGPGVLCCSMWLLASAPDSPYAPIAWFQPESQTLPVVGTLKQWFAGHETTAAAHTFYPRAKGAHPIAHYLLLPLYEWGVADWHLDVIRPFVKKFKPTVGFSLQEAANALQVTVVGNESSFTDEALELLRKTGSVVERISGNGTDIATILAER